PTPESDDWLTQTLYYVQNIFCTGRFYPLFSMLFGMGLVLMMTSSSRRGNERGFAMVYLRRLVALLAFGLIHGLGIWFGDVLFTYALCGAILLICRSWPAKALLPVGVGLVLVATLMYSGLAAMSAFGIADQEAQQAKLAQQSESAQPGRPAADESAAFEAPDPNAPPPAREREPDGLDRLAQTRPFFALINGYRDDRISGGPEHPKYIRLETRAYQDGPWLDAQLFRLTSWALFLVITALSLFWHVLGLFFIGAGLMKLGVATEGFRTWRTRLILAGLLIGLPLSIVSTLCMAHPDSPLLAIVMVWTGFTGGPLLALMYFCLAIRLSEATFAPARVLARTLAAAGRMALSNYLTQSLVSTFVFYHWGLGQFGLWTRGEKWLMVLCVFATQCLLSVLWLRIFRMGPMEWLWRSLTYWRLQPLLRGGGDGPA
ncbi:MAG: DUF418 domain-containing protein, partial [Phycisphaerales bacterium]|nr:DUF418 domain-containing protein [Phycisphaerales bacterium]